MPLTGKSRRALRLAEGRRQENQARSTATTSSKARRSRTSETVGRRLRSSLRGSRHLAARVGARRRPSPHTSGRNGYHASTSIVTAMLVPSPLHRNELKPPDRSVQSSESEGRLEDGWIEFRPARWLVATIALLWLWLVRPQFGKRELVVSAWQFTPRRLKLIAGGVAAVALVVLAGSVAALVLMLVHLA